MYRLLQEQVQPRMLVILLVLIVLMALVASYLYVLKEPLQNLRQYQQTLSLLENEVQTGIPLQNQIKIQQQVVKKLNIKLHGTGPKLPVNKMIAYVIGELDKIANHHKIKLLSIKPQKTGTLFTFKELPFQVELSGEYFGLFSWLKDVENNLGFIVIKKFDISSIGEDKQRKMFLTIAAYQFEDTK